MIALGKPSKGSSPDMEEESSEGPEAEYAKEAFGALKDDDQDGFVKALLGAIRCCSKSDEEEDEEV